MLRGIDSARLLRCLPTLLMCLYCLQVRILVAADAVDYSEYDAILSLDESLISQLADGWHGGFTVDNAVPDNDSDSDANIGADLRYLAGDSELFSRLQVVDRDIYRARVQYSHLLFETAATRWRGVVGAGYDNDVFTDSAYGADFEDRDTDAVVALVLEHDFESVFVSSELLARWRRFERSGKAALFEQTVDQPTEIDVEKDFRTLAWNLSAQWQFDAIEQSVWLQAAHVTDMDVSVCLDDLCLAADAVEDTFTVYDAMFNQEWYLTARHRDGVSLVTQLACYTASVDHLPAGYQFSIGGMYSVRGYDEVIADGDEMALWRNELRLPWRSSSAWLAGLRQHVYVFYDWGRVWQHAIDVFIDDRAIELLPEDSTRLSGAGIGIDLAIVNDVSLHLEYAVVQTAIAGLVDPGDSRVHASIDWRAF